MGFSRKCVNANSYKVYILLCMLYCITSAQLARLDLMIQHSPLDLMTTACVLRLVISLSDQSDHAEECMVQGLHAISQKIQQINVAGVATDHARTDGLRKRLQIKLAVKGNSS
jgi:hypothetical protein